MKMEINKKTELQKIIEQITRLTRDAIEQAIENGAIVERLNSYTNLLECCRIDGLYLQKRIPENTISLILDFGSEKIAKVFEPSRSDIEKLISQKRAELEVLEKQIKEL